MKKLLPKLFHLVILVTFIWFANVQSNDDDRLLWIVIYLSVAIVAFMALREKSKSWEDRKHSKYFTRTLARVFIIPLFVLFLFKINLLTQWLEAGRPAFIDYEKTDIQAVEAIREFLGLALTILVLLFYSVRPVKEERSLSETSDLLTQS